MKRLLRLLSRLFLAPAEHRWMAIGVDDRPIYGTAHDEAEGAARIAAAHNIHFLRVERFTVIRNRGERRTWLEVTL